MSTNPRPLDRRRDKAGAAGATAAKAEAAVTDIDRQLETVKSLTEQQEQALHRAVEEAERLKRSIKAAGKRRAELVKERQRAVTKAEQARAKADAAEAKYDKEVLADLVRREKEKDRASSSEPAPEEQSTAGKELEPAPERAPAVPSRRTPARSSRAGTDADQPDSDPPARSSRRSPAADPPPEQVDEGTRTARRTAARKTATKAARLIR